MLVLESWHASRLLTSNARSIDGRVQSAPSPDARNVQDLRSRKCHVHRQCADNSSAAGFCPEAIDERLNPIPSLAAAIRASRSPTQRASSAAPPRRTRIVFDTVRRERDPEAWRVVLLDTRTRAGRSTTGCATRCPCDPAVSAGVHGSTANVGASSPARPFSSGSNTASRSAVPGRIGRPLTVALHTVEPAGASPSRSCAGYCAPHTALRRAGHRLPRPGCGSELPRRWR